MDSDVDKISNCNAKQDGSERSTFFECAFRLILQRLDQIGQRGSTRRFDEDVDRHAGHQLGRAELCKLLRLEQDTGRVVARIGALLLRNICGNHADLSVDFGCRLLIERLNAANRIIAVWPT